MPPQSSSRGFVSFDQELVDEVALGTHDLDAVVAGVLRESAEFAKSAIVASIARADSSDGVNGLIGALIFDGATESG